ncbi:hypothetical protein K474DRAFT_1591823 [Panus rudis PR-1116 ss-1]|nr:hypothetical protein K474DRAFT_1591823 [Panus rudis PR-1116 ss-1]
MSSSSLQPEQPRPLPTNIQQQSTPTSSTPSPLSHAAGHPVFGRASFPSYPASAHTSPSSHPIASSSESVATSSPFAQYPSQSYARSNAHARQVIDLTSSPSPPPPQPVQRVLPSSQSPQGQVSSSGTLPSDLPPKTPVCIGQLTVTALVLYPISYLSQHPIGNADPDWAPVRLAYDSNAGRPGAQPTIHIRTPNTTSPMGESIPGENFAVVEQKVATFLGPLLGKGLIRLDGKVRRKPGLPILPLRLLVFTPKGNIPPVSTFLQQSGLLLDHPSSPADIQRLSGQHYLNPHNPPPGGFAQAAAAGGNSRLGYCGPGGNGMGRWNSNVAAKSVEVQRSQVDELFKSLKDGDELEETDCPPEVATPLYPHQKKALTFLLERERERRGRDGTYSSLWQERYNELSHQRSWFHVVTQREIFEEPQEAKSAILADDMGLGKTITCVSLIASTLRSAQEFASAPLELPPPPEPTSQDQNLVPDHFAGSVWGIPTSSTASKSAKAKAKEARELGKLEGEYNRACRLKAKSRATLIVCPLSTVVNWEDQFREHWGGPVVVVGGGGHCGPSSALASSSSPSTPQPVASASGSSNVLPHSSQIMKGTVVKSEPSNGIVDRTRDGTPFKVYVYHGNARRPDPSFLADFDAVITTYSTLATEYSKQCRSVTNTEDDDDGGASSDGVVEIDERGNSILKLSSAKKNGLKKRKKNALNSNGVSECNSALQSVYWFRVVLDEAHSIKETSTVACRACCDLVADRRLCLTGTPVQNKLDDVYALIKFLRLGPFDDKSVWTEFIGTPVKYGQPLGVARLQTIMKCITLRRTKESKAENGQRILSLPPRRDELRYLKFDEQEQAIYDQFFTESKAEFNELSNKNEVMKNYVGILQKILRLRQICDHFELVMNKGLGLIGDNQSQEQPTYEHLAAAVAKEGINLARANAIFCLLREAGTAQCVECTYEFGVPSDANVDACGVAEAETSSQPKRGRKPKNASSRASTRQNSPALGQAILTRCQHLFCAGCYRNSCFPGWPNVPSDTRRCCPVCQTALLPADAVEINPEWTPDGSAKKKNVKREKKPKGTPIEQLQLSTKIRALLSDLIQFSRANPHSANYDPEMEEIQMVDNQGNRIDDGVVKTVVFSQWTSMLDKVEEALDAVNIRYDRLDGTMKRDDRTRAMEALKHDPACEVLLVSLKAGGVGLNLTAAQRVYLMDPYWNPAVENQAVDRIHRLGQKRPVTTVKLIIENTIEARLLEVQRKKTELANMTLGQNFSKAEMHQRRLEELNALFGG